jgi:hypothetical protein
MTRSVSVCALAPNVIVFQDVPLVDLETKKEELLERISDLPGSIFDPSLLGCFVAGSSLYGFL